MSCLTQLAHHLALQGHVHAIAPFMPHSLACMSIHAYLGAGGPLFTLAHPIAHTPTFTTQTHKEATR